MLKRHSHWTKLQRKTWTDTCQLVTHNRSKKGYFLSTVSTKLPKIGTKREEIRKKQGNEGKIGKKRKNREGSFILPLLTNRAGYATGVHACTELTIRKNLSGASPRASCQSTVHLSHLETWCRWCVWVVHVHVSSVYVWTHCNGRQSICYNKALGLYRKMYLFEPLQRRCNSPQHQRFLLFRSLLLMFDPHWHNFDPGFRPLWKEKKSFIWYII